MAGEDLILKISADTSAVASGLAPMTTALDKLGVGANEAGDQLGRLDGLSVAPTVDDSGLKAAAGSLEQVDQKAADTKSTLDGLSRDKVSPLIDTATVDKLTQAASDSGKQLGKLADPVTLSIRDQAIDRARQRIEDLKDQIAEDVSMGVDTKPALRELSTLERSISQLTDEPQTVDIQVNPDDADFAFESMAKLRRGVRSMTDAVVSAGDGLKALPDLVSAGVGSFTTLNASMSQFLEKQAAIGKGAGPLASRLGKVTGFLAGPWGLAIAGGITVLGAMVGKMNDADQATKDFAKSLDYQTGALDRNNRMKAATKLIDDGLVGKITALGLSAEDFTSALAGDAVALSRVNAQMDAIRNKDFDKGMRDGTLAVSDSTQKVNILQDAFGKLTGATGAAAAQSKLLGDIVDGAGGAASAAATGVDALATATSDATSAMTSHQAIWVDYSTRISDAQTALDKLVDSLDLFNERTATAHEATATYEEDVDALTAALKKNGATTKDHGKTLDLSSAAGRENQAVIIKTAHDIEALRIAREKDMATSGESTAQIMADYDAQKASLIKMADKLGLSGKAAKAYVDALLLAPATVDTDVKLHGADKAETDLERLAREREATIKVVLNVDKFALNEARRRAQEIAAGNLGPSTSSAPAPVPTPRASTVFMQPRLYLDSRPIRAALRGDVQTAVTSTMATTRTRGRL